jgi:hypothetical protein
MISVSFFAKGATTVVDRAGGAIVKAFQAMVAFAFLPCGATCDQFDRLNRAIARAFAAGDTSLADRKWFGAAKC